jgi:hypothetical protein
MPRNQRAMAEGEPVFFGLLLIFVIMIVCGILGTYFHAFGPT